MIQEKKYVRAPLIKTAKEGRIPYSIDSVLYGMKIKTNPWDAITIYGAQLSRPPYDPYRENIDLSLKLRGSHQGLILDSPIIIGTDCTTTQAAHDALNALGEQGIVYAAISSFIPERYKSERKYRVILKSADQANADEKFADGFLTEFEGGAINRLKLTGKPILAYARQPEQIAQILYAGADAVVVDVSGTPMEQLTKIITAKKLFAEYFRGADIYKTLIIADGPNDSGKVVKTIAMGAATAHGVVYDIEALFGAVAAEAVGNIERANGGFSLSDASALIMNYLAGTMVELTQLTAAPGYSRIHNVSHADLRTSSPEVSLATGILMEGLNESWFDFHKRMLEQEFRSRGINPKDFDLEELTLRLMQMI